jgi:hypothetical protein
MKEGRYILTGSLALRMAYHDLDVAIRVAHRLTSDGCRNAKITDQRTGREILFLAEIAA